jgi:hypothetical protein
MLTRLYCCSVVPIFPKSALSQLLFVVNLSDSACYKLHQPGNSHLVFRSQDQKMDMIRSDRKIEDGHSIPKRSLGQPFYPQIAVYGILQKELPVMAPMCNMPHVARDKKSNRSWHSVS